MAGPSWVSTRGRSTDNLTDDERFFCENSDRAVTLAESSDPDADYSYDDYALAELDGVYYIFNTSGCSCPSPDETWELEFKGNRDELLDRLVSGGLTQFDTSSRRWSRGKESWHEFLRQVEATGIVLRTPAPAPSRSRYDW